MTTIKVKAASPHDKARQQAQFFKAADTTHKSDIANG